MRRSGVRIPLAPPGPTFSRPFFLPPVWDLALLDQTGVHHEQCHVRSRTTIGGRTAGAGGVTPDRVV